MENVIGGAFIAAGERRSPAVAATRDARRRRGARVLPPGRARVRFVPVR